MNETDFQVGCGKSQLVVTMDPNKLLCMINFNNCENINSVECIGSLGEFIPLMLLISGVNILYK